MSNGPKASRRTAFASAPYPANPDAMQFYAARLIAVRWHQGRVGELEPLVAQVTADTPGVPGFAA